jgi:hypothetical protein
LGLYICRKIVDAHGGRISIARRHGGGATVSFSLPLLTAVGGGANGSGTEASVAGPAPATPAAR